MKKIMRFISMMYPALLLLTLLSGNASAALQAVGPTDPVTTIPTFYQDTANMALVPCLDQNGFCLLPPPFDPLLPPVSTITTTGPITDANFPAEGFYFSAQAIMPIEASGELANLAFVLEYAFLSGVVPDAGIIFLRTDLQKMRNLTPNSTYRVTHPYGTFEFSTDGIGSTTGPGGVAVRQEDGSGVAANFLPPLMKAAAATNMGPFLTRAVGGLIVDPVSGHTYIGDAITPVAVTGSPTGNNFFRIERLNASGNPVPGAVWETNLFVLMGRVFDGQIPSPMSIDRVTYARDAASEQIDVFATALPNATLTISGTGIANTDLTRDLTPNTTKYFTHIPLASTTLPTGLNITNSLDIPPINYSVTLVDDVIISQAFYNPVSRTLTIKADSRDNLAPLPTLTVPQLAAPNTLDATGTLVKTLAANTIPPLTVTVQSSKLGKATAFVSVVTPPAPPVAVGDATSTTANTAVVVNVLINDTTTGTLDPATILTAAPVGGTAVANANGSVTFTPNTGFSGAASFTYTVKDTFGQISNSAIVAITVNPPSGPATGASVATNLVSPEAAQGTQITFIASGSGGSGSYEYSYWLFNGTSWSETRPYSTNDTWIWNTTGLPTGIIYTIAVNVRNVGSTTPFEAVVYRSVQLNSTTINTLLTANISSPQLPGPSVTFSAAASGSSGNYMYQFYLFNGTTWTLVRDFTSAPTWTWNTTGLPAGDYLVGVNVMNSSLVGTMASSYLNYTLTP